MGGLLLGSGRALRAIREREGKDAIHEPERAHLFVANDQVRASTVQARDVGDGQNNGSAAPRQLHVGEDGQAVYTSQQIAEKCGISVEEVERLAALADPEAIYTGPVFPLQ